jgi:hypothetical protein
MNNAKWLKFINPLLLALVLWQVTTGTLADVIGHDLFEATHPLGGILLAVCVAIHLFFNRAWIKATYFRKPR